MAPGALAGQVALITGAGQGVGQGIALALASAGVDIAVVGRTPATLEETCELVRARGVKAEPFVLDVLDTDRIPGVVDGVVETFGGVDILVNNAYSGSYGLLAEMSDEAFQKGFVSGPFAAFAMMRSCYPHLQRSKNANVINLVSAVMVRWDTTTFGAYASAKLALRSLTRTAAVEWGADNIRVNAIAPHALSPGLARWTEANPEEAAAFVKTIPMGRIGDCEEDIGQAVVSLVGPGMRYLTGATLPLEGGQATF